MKLLKNKTGIMVAVILVGAFGYSYFAPRINKRRMTMPWRIPWRKVRAVASAGVGMSMAA